MSYEKRLTKVMQSTLLGCCAMAQGEIFVVTNLANSGNGSLREAIELANATEEPDIVTFSRGENGTIDFQDGISRQISVRPTLSVTQPLEIQGPGKNRLILDAGGDENFQADATENRIFSLTGSTDENPHHLSDLTIRRGVAFSGGANIRVFGSLLIQRCDISGGRAIATNLNENSNSSQNADGGGLFHSGGHLQIEACDFFENTTLGNFSQGGGIYSERGTASIIASRIFDNTTNGIVSEGGGIGLRSDTVMTDCEVSGNETLASSSGGGGIYTDSNFSAFNTTISANIVGATTGIDGYSVGGAFASVGGEARFVCCTIVDNEAPPGQGQGGGISTLSRGQISFLATICIGNDAVDVERIPNASTQFVDEGYNLLGIGQGFDSITSQQATSSYGTTSRAGVVSDLDFHGGRTRTHRLLDNSAINTGPTRIDLSSIAEEVDLFDQRGGNFPRVVGGHADIGAYEVQTFLDSDNDGLPDAVEAVVNGLDPATPDGAEDLDGDGDSNVNEYNFLGILAINDAQLKVQLTVEQGEEDNEISLNFQNSADREYRILRGVELSPSLMTADSNFFRPAEDGRQRITTTISGSREFFRIEGRIPAKFTD